MIDISWEVLTTVVRISKNLERSRGDGKWKSTGEFVTHVGVTFVNFSESNKCIHCVV